MGKENVEIQEYDPNGDICQKHRCSSRRKNDFSSSLEGGGTGCREPGGAEWPSGEIISAKAQQWSWWDWNCMLVTDFKQLFQAMG